jgi:bacillithiol biosynthesis deacetylase BshB1
MTDTDVLAFGAHPDDIELGCGGTLAKLVDAGRSIVLVDMTRGELGTRGTVETRWEEARKAAQILGVATRENIGLPDGDLRATPAAKRAVVEVIRRFRPQLIFVPYWCDRHPDHAHASELVYEGAFLAGLPRYETGQASYRPKQVLYYMGWEEFSPSFIVDISAQFERKMEAIRAYASQFTLADSTYPETCLTTPATDRLIRGRMAYYGALIGKEYGEGFLIRGVLEVEDPMKARFSSF